jgi:hypothetical protein
LGPDHAPAEFGSSGRASSNDHRSALSGINVQFPKSLIFHESTWRLEFFSPIAAHKRVEVVEVVADVLAIDDVEARAFAFRPTALQRSRLAPEI